MPNAFISYYHLSPLYFGLPLIFLTSLCQCPRRPQLLSLQLVLSFHLWHKNRPSDYGWLGWGGSSIIQWIMTIKPSESKAFRSCEWGFHSAYHLFSSLHQ